jgi:hypothetical protein
MGSSADLLKKAPALHRRQRAAPPLLSERMWIRVSREALPGHLPSTRQAPGPRVGPERPYSSPDRSVSTATQLTSLHEMMAPMPIPSYAYTMAFLGESVLITPSTTPNSHSTYPRSISMAGKHHVHGSKICTRTSICRRGQIALP